MANILRDLSVGDLHLIRLMKTLQEVRENGKSEIFSELSLLSVSGVWLDKIYETKGYSKRLCRRRPRSEADR